MPRPVSSTCPMVPALALDRILQDQPAPLVGVAGRRARCEDRRIELVARHKCVDLLPIYAADSISRRTDAAR